MINLFKTDKQFSKKIEKEIENFLVYHEELYKKLPKEDFRFIITVLQNELIITRSARLSFESRGLSIMVGLLAVAMIFPSPYKVFILTMLSIAFAIFCYLSDRFEQAIRKKKEKFQRVYDFFIKQSLN